MSTTPSRALLAIICGSVAGALLRQVIIVALAESARTSPGRALAVTGIGGLMLGALMGGVAKQSPPEGTWRPIMMIALMALLAAFGSGAVMSMAPVSADQAGTLLYVAALHIATATAAASTGLFVVRSARARSNQLRGKHR